jgi:hypothetical protein
MKKIYELHKKNKDKKQKQKKRTIENLDKK